MLYSVALPIGNPKDISQRAIEILQVVDIILAEDTRKFFDTIRRANFYTKANVISYYSYNENKINFKIQKYLQYGNSIAIVSDRGTPNISDPGRKIIHFCFENNIPVIPIPGSSALSCIMSILPFPNQPLLFLGFLSNKKQRRKNTLLQYKDFIGCIIIFESRHRVVHTLEIIQEVYNKCIIFIAREMTKEYENFFYGKIQLAIDWCKKNEKGEFTIAIFSSKRNTKQ